MAQGVLGFFQTCVWLVWNVGLYWQRVSEHQHRWLSYRVTLAHKVLLAAFLAMAHDQKSKTTSDRDTARGEAVRRMDGRCART
jgi:hypothetical protein